DANPAAYPGHPEACDGADNDCNNLVDEGNPGGGQVCATGGDGECASGTTFCAGAGGLTCVPDQGPTCEDCGNGRDDDCDGLVDEAGDAVGGDGAPHCSETSGDATE